MNTTACQTRKTRHDCQTRKTPHDCQTRKTRHDCTAATAGTPRRCGYAHGPLERLPRVYEPLPRTQGEPFPLGRWDHRQLRSACAKTSTRSPAVRRGCDLA